MTPCLENECRSHDAAKEDIARSDRQRWFPHTDFAIFRSADVPVAVFNRKEDRDSVLRFARSWDAMKAALEGAQHKLEIYRSVSDGRYIGGKEYSALATEISDALKLAGGK